MKHLEHLGASLFDSIIEFNNYSLKCWQDSYQIAHLVVDEPVIILFSDSSILMTPTS